MQPIYLTQTSSGSSPWKLTNWRCTPVNIGVSVACNSSSTFQIDYTLDDVTGSFPNPTLGASAPTFLSSFSGSSSANAAFTTPVAVAEPGLSGIDNQQRYRALLCLENLPSIETWRATLSEKDASGSIIPTPSGRIFGARHKPGLGAETAAGAAGDEAGANCQARQGGRRCGAPGADRFFGGKIICAAHIERCSTREVRIC